MGNSWEWHIDHITPIKYKENGEYPSLEEIMERLHYTNLQSLSGRIPTRAKVTDILVKTYYGAW